MGEVRSPRFLPVLLGLLAPARGARRGADGAPGLRRRRARVPGEALADAALPLELRRHLPRTIALFDPAPAAARAAAPAARGARGRAALPHAARASTGWRRRPTWRSTPGCWRRRRARPPRASSACCTGVSLLESGAREQPGARHPGPRAAGAAAEGQGGAGDRAPAAAAGAAAPGRGLPRHLPGAALAGRPAAGEQPRAAREPAAPPLRQAIRLAIVSEASGRVAARGRGRPLRRAQPLDYRAVLERILDEGGESLRCVAVAPHRRARPRRRCARRLEALAGATRASSCRACSSARSWRCRALPGAVHA